MKYFTLQTRKSVIIVKTSIPEPFYNTGELLYRGTTMEIYKPHELLEEWKQMFGREARNYFLDEDKINIYRAFFGDKAETIFREEAEDTSYKPEAVIKSLRRMQKIMIR